MDNAQLMVELEVREIKFRFFCKSNGLDIFSRRALKAWYAVEEWCFVNTNTFQTEEQRILLLIIPFKSGQVWGM